jgi:hypothetical protein
LTNIKLLYSGACDYEKSGYVSLGSKIAGIARTTENKGLNDGYERKGFQRGTAELEGGVVYQLPDGVS